MLASSSSAPTRALSQARVPSRSPPASDDQGRDEADRDQNLKQGEAVATRAPHGNGPAVNLRRDQLLRDLGEAGRPASRGQDVEPQAIAHQQRMAAEAHGRAVLRDAQPPAQPILVNSGAFAGREAARRPRFRRCREGPSSAARDRNPRAAGFGRPGHGVQQRPSASAMMAKATSASIRVKPFRRASRRRTCPPPVSQFTEMFAVVRPSSSRAMSPPVEPPSGRN